MGVTKAMQFVRRIIPRLLFLAVLWSVLTGGDWGSWAVGVPVVVAAAWASLALAPPWHDRLSVRGLLRFIPFFLWHSLHGGLDVSWRALHPAMPLRPHFYDYPLRLPRGTARLLFVDSLSLLPGTLSATLYDEQDYVTVHILVGERSAVEKLQSLETAIGRLFRLDLPPPPPVTEQESEEAG